LVGAPGGNWGWSFRGWDGQQRQACEAFVFCTHAHTWFVQTDQVLKGYDTTLGFVSAALDDAFCLFGHDGMVKPPGMVSGSRGASRPGINMDLFAPSS